MNPIATAITQHPIFYLSLHGSYPLGDYNKPGDIPDDQKQPLIIQVPNDMLVIETGDIGWACYFTNFIKVMKELLLDRTRLLQYMAGHPPKTDTLEQQFLFSGALRSCHIYLPGSSIANRFLAQETGRRGSEGARTSDYGREMRFFRYDVGRSERVEIFKKLRTNLIEEAYGRYDESTRRERMIQSTAFTTYEVMFSYLHDLEIDGLKVVFFPVCGEVESRVAGQPIRNDKDLIDLIIDVQRQADNSWTNFIGGRSLKSVYDEINHQYHGSKTVIDGARFVGRSHYYKGPGEVIPSGEVFPSSNCITRSKSRMIHQTNEHKQIHNQILMIMKSMINIIRDCFCCKKLK